MEGLHFFVRPCQRKQWLKASIKEKEMKKVFLFLMLMTAATVSVSAQFKDTGHQVYIYVEKTDTDYDVNSMLAFCFGNGKACVVNETTNRLGQTETYTLADWSEKADSAFIGQQISTLGYKLKFARATEQVVYLRKKNILTTINDRPIRATANLQYKFSADREELTVVRRTDSTGSYGQIEIKKYVLLAVD
jgi:uncharacterized protein YcgL (UPF0745 family)